MEPAPFTPQDLQRLVTWHMPFGRYQGTLLADLPGEYLGWFARVGFPDGQIGHLLAVMFEISHNGLGHLLAPLRAQAEQQGAGVGSGRTGRRVRLGPAGRPNDDPGAGPARVGP